MSDAPRTTRFGKVAAAYPGPYTWYVLVSALDLMLTNFALNHLGGMEVNGVARRVIEAAGFPGLIALKVSTMVVVIAVCEVLARKHPAVGRRVSEWAVAISAVPVMLMLAQAVAAVLR